MPAKKKFVKRRPRSAPKKRGLTAVEKKQVKKIAEKATHSVAEDKYMNTQIFNDHPHISHDRILRV